MPYTPIRGFDGKVTEAAATLVSVTDWEADLNIEITKDGPFLNDSGKIYKILGGTEAKGKVKGKVPSGRDAAITAIAAAIGASAGLDLTLDQGVYSGGATGGYRLIVSGALISNLKVGQDSKNGAPFEFDWESNGHYILV
jgi:hypothetical protein